MVKDKKEGNKWHVFKTIQNPNSTNKYGPFSFVGDGVDTLALHFVMFQS